MSFLHKHDDKNHHSRFDYENVVVKDLMKALNNVEGQIDQLSETVDKIHDQLAVFSHAPDLNFDKHKNGAKVQWSMNQSPRGVHKINYVSAVSMDGQFAIGHDYGFDVFATELHKCNKRNQLYYERQFHGRDEKLRNVKIVEVVPHENCVVLVAKHQPRVAALYRCTPTQIAVLAYLVLEDPIIQVRANAKEVVFVTQKDPADDSKKFTMYDLRGKLQNAKAAKDIAKVAETDTATVRAAIKNTSFEGFFSEKTVGAGQTGALVEDTFFFRCVCLQNTAKKVVFDNACRHMAEYKTNVVHLWKRTDDGHSLVALAQHLVDAPAEKAGFVGLGTFLWALEDGAYKFYEVPTSAPAKTKVVHGAFATVKTDEEVAHLATARINHQIFVKLLTKEGILRLFPVDKEGGDLESL